MWIAVVQYNRNDSCQRCCRGNLFFMMPLWRGYLIFVCRGDFRHQTILMCSAVVRTKSGGTSSATTPSSCHGSPVIILITNCDIFPCCRTSATAVG